MSLLRDEEYFNIAEVKAREILDSKGIPMVEVDVVTNGGVLGRAGAPCGISAGKYEAVTLRDNDSSRYLGLGVLKAITNIQNVIAPKIIGKDVRMQRQIDKIMIHLDGTERKANLGGNTTLSVSYAVAEAAANALRLPLYRYIGGVNAHILPLPMFNIINGGPYSVTDLDFQEFMIMPKGAKSFSEVLRISVEVYHELKKVLKKHYGKKGSTPGHAGGYSPPISDPMEAFDRILEAVDEAGHTGKIVLCLDCAASHIYDKKEGKYVFMGKKVTREFLMDFYEDLTKTYPLFLLEDPLHEDDFEGHAELTRDLTILIVGDDLFATNLKRLEKGVKMGAANGIILKPNQIGTLSEAIDVAQFAMENKYAVIPSIRSCSRYIEPLADISVALNCKYCKFGAPTTGERTYHYNRLLQIEEELGNSAVLHSIHI